MTLAPGTATPAWLRLLAAAEIHRMACPPELARDTSAPWRAIVINIKIIPCDDDLGGGHIFVASGTILPS
jgi:hypothetical protein